VGGSHRAGGKRDQTRQGDIRQQRAVRALWNWQLSAGQRLAHCQRLFNVYGGQLSYYNNYSWAQIQRATPTVYGTQVTGGQRQDWLNAKYIIMWSWNPAEMIDGSNSAWFIKKARENGAKVVVIDPRKSLHPSRWPTSGFPSVLVQIRR
jgi:anaerobic selenocysteine-containing dehydrogenase